MPQTFPDGFPSTPEEAIQYSYFFSDEEKKEWMEWLQTATPEEKNELVEMLHRIWTDKQKQVVPDQFNNNSFQPNTTTPSNEAQLPISEQSQEAKIADPTVSNSFTPPNLSSSPTTSQPQNSTSTTTPSFGFNPVDFGLSQPSPSANLANNETSNPALSNPFSFVSEDSSQKTISSPNLTNPANAAGSAGTTPSFANFNDDFSFMDDLDDEDLIISPPAESGIQPIDPVDTDAKTTPNPVTNKQGFVSSPILDEPKPNPSDYGLTASDDIGAATEPATNTANTNQTTKEAKDKGQVRSSDVNQNDKKSSQPSFSLAKVRESGTEAELEMIYDNYIATRDEINSHRDEHEQAFDTLLSKVMKIALTFEHVSDYLESMTTKLVDMNDLIVKQSQKITSFRVSQNDSLQNMESKIEEMANQLDRFKKTASSNIYQLRHRMDEAEVQLSGMGMNTYSDQEGMWTQIELLKGQVMKLQNELNMRSAEQELDLEGTRKTQHEGLKTTKEKTSQQTSRATPVAPLAPTKSSSSINIPINKIKSKKDGEEYSEEENMFD